MKVFGVERLNRIAQAHGSKYACYPPHQPPTNTIIEKKKDKLHTPTFLKKNGISSVKKLGIDVKYHNRYPNLVLLKYQQESADFRDPVVCECRGNFQIIIVNV